MLLGAISKILIKRPEGENMAISEVDLEKALNPEEGNNINWSVLQSIQNLIKENKRKPVKKGWTIAKKIMHWIGSADFQGTKADKVLFKYFGKNFPFEKEDDPKKIETIEKIVNQLLKKRPHKQGGMKNIMARLDALANELEKENPELALAVDLISDRLEKVAGIPKPLPNEELLMPIYTNKS